MVAVVCGGGGGMYKGRDKNQKKSDQKNRIKKISVQHEFMEISIQYKFMKISIRHELIKMSVQNVFPKCLSKMSV